MKKQLGLVKNEFPEPKQVIPLEDRTKTLQDIQPPEKNLKKNKNK